MPRTRKTPRRTAGSGAVIYEKDRRRWRGRVTRPDGSRKSVTAASKEKAVEKLNVLLGQVALGPTEDTKLTVETWLKHWLANVAPARSKSPQTLASDRWAVDCHLIPGLGRRKLVALSAEDVEQFLQKRADDGLSKHSLVRLRTVLGKALDEAIRRERLARNNVAKLAVVPVDARAPKEGRSLTIEQAKELLKAAAEPLLPPLKETGSGPPRPNQYGAMVVVGLMLGLRPGEVSGLVWEDVDFDSNTLRVDKALIRGPRSNLARSEPKTRKSRRILNMPAPVADALRRHRSIQTMRAVDPEEDYVFKTSAGTPIDPSNLRRYLDELCDAAGIGHWSPNELRHSAASLLSAAGVPIDQAADLLGHADTRMLDRHYRHATTKSFSAAVAPMEEMFGPS